MTPRCTPASAMRARGIALVAVMWMVLALGVLATGLVSVARSEVRQISERRTALRAEALGDAAISLALAGMMQAPNDRLAATAVDFEGARIDLGFTPLSGLVDLNSAPEPLIAELFAVAGGIDRSEAALVARNVVDFRDRDQRTARGEPEYEAYRESPFAPRDGPFVLAQDLLQVPGVGLDLYARLAPLVTVELAGDGLVNPLAAPLAVLQVLAGGDPTLAAQYAEARERDGVRADTSRLRADFIGRGVSRRLRVEALVPVPDGGRLSVLRVVDLGGLSAGGAPWDTLGRHSSFVREPAR